MRPDQSKNVVVAGKTDIKEGSVIAQDMGNGVNVQIEAEGYAITNTEVNYNNIFFKADSSIGIVQMPNDNDGVVRRYQPFVYDGPSAKLLPSFSFAVLNKYFGFSSLTCAGRSPEYFQLADRMIPKFDNKSMLIDFYGPSRTFKYVDFAQVLDDHTFKTKDELDVGEDIDEWDFMDKSIFKDKIVLIGSSMPEDRDIIPVSFSKGDNKGDNLMNGVEIHANAVQNILSRNFIQKEPQSVEIIVIIALCFITFYFSSLLKSC